MGNAKTFWGHMVRFELLEDGFLPERATDDSVGYDLRAKVGGSVAPGQRTLVPLGFKMALPRGVEAQVRPRSGLALRDGITVLNAPGTIDPDFRGENMVILVNHSPVNTFAWDRGDRIAQMVFSKYESPRIVEVADLGKTDRGEGGFGSTGVA